MQQPTFKRVIISQEEINAKDEWATKTFKDEIKNRTFLVENCGNTCDEEVKSLVGKKVVISEVNTVKIAEENNKNFYIVPQETILTYEI